MRICTGPIEVQLPVEVRAVRVQLLQAVEAPITTASPNLLRCDVPVS